MIVDWPWWAWLIVGHLTGLLGGLAIALGLGIGRAVREDTLHVLADMQQLESDTEPGRGP